MWACHAWLVSTKCSGSRTVCIETNLTIVLFTFSHQETKTHTWRSYWHINIWTFAKAPTQLVFIWLFLSHEMTIVCFYYHYTSLQREPLKVPWMWWRFPYGLCILKNQTLLKCFPKKGHIIEIMHKKKIIVTQWAILCSNLTEGTAEKTRG